MEKELEEIDMWVFIFGLCLFIGSFFDYKASHALFVVAIISFQIRYLYFKD